MSENGVECWSEPEVALTVMVYVADCGADEAPPEFPLPHPLSMLNPITLTASSTANWESRRLFQPMQHTRAASALMGNSGLVWRRIIAIERS